ncbi:glycosyltransferase family 2 protein, partial [bacterium]|nr:glycosyltransferase family 2 protein [bacterium]
MNYRSTNFPGSITIVVPIYNSEQILPILIQRLEKTLPTISDHYEVILVNDGSQDKSWQKIERLSMDYPWVRGLNLMRNYGQHNALLCGIRKAKYAVIVTMDDDLQNPPEEIPKLLEALSKGYDVVYGSPQKEQHGSFRNLASQITKITLQSIIGAETARNVSSFRAFKTKLRDAFRNYSGSDVSIDVLLTWGTNKFTFIPVQHDPRFQGESHYTFRKLVTHALNMMTGFSILPLQIASLVGFIFTLFGLVVLAYVLGRFVIQGGSVPGFPFLASIVAIFSGAQLFALGIIGEYL